MTFHSASNDRCQIFDIIRTRVLLHLSIYIIIKYAPGVQFYVKYSLPDHVKYYSLAGFVTIPVLPRVTPFVLIKLNWKYNTLVAVNLNTSVFPHLVFEMRKEVLKPPLW